MGLMVTVKSGSTQRSDRIKVMAGINISAKHLSPWFHNKSERGANLCIKWTRNSPIKPINIDTFRSVDLLLLCYHFYSPPVAFIILVH